MLKTFIFALCLMQSAFVFAQGSNNTGEYYRYADGAKGSALKTALATVILPHDQLSYAELWTAFYTTDCRPDGKVWDMYSDNTNFTFGTNQDKGSHPSEGYAYNREHSFPKSWFGGNVFPMYTDLIHLVPTDAYVNEKRSNYPFGETAGEKYKSHGGFSKLGNSTISGYTGIVFEPADEYKGDFARIYFYMVTAYEDQVATWNCDMLDHSSYPALSSWALPMLLRWAEEDPVSDKETARNNAVNERQGNRNPFVDYPGLEQYIWGALTNQPFSYDKYLSPVGIVSLPTNYSTTPSAIYDLLGRPVSSIQHSGIYIINGRKVVVK